MASDSSKKPFHKWAAYFIAGSLVLGLNLPKKQCNLNERQILDQVKRALKKNLTNGGNPAG
jgi:hypothetical protein